MPVSPARAAAFDILLRVDRDDSYAPELLHSPVFATLSTRDHGLATELVMGVLRWRSPLDARIDAASSKQIAALDPEVLTALRMAAYQLAFLSRVPTHAAIFESVELVKAARKRSAAPFVNAVLRNMANGNAGDVSEAARERAIADSSDEASLALSSAHPSWLVRRWIRRFGLEVAKKICAHDQTIPPTAIRIQGGHPEIKTADPKAVAAALTAAGIELASGLLLSGARRVLNGDIAATAAYKEGRTFIQDEASQLVASLASGPGTASRIEADSAILDCCAAPGGKTTLLAERNPGAIVVATDLHPHRARLLQALARSPNIRVVAADARNLPFVRKFERILVDAPCSGTGTLARNPEIKWRLKIDDLRDLQARQVAILKSALSQLADGGRLIYSTCSLEPEENGDVVEAVLRAQTRFTVKNLADDLARLRQSSELCWQDLASLIDGPYLRTLPGVHPCDGFFAASIG